MPLIRLLIYHIQLVLRIQRLFQRYIIVSVARSTNKAPLIIWMPSKRTLVRFDWLQNRFVWAPALELAQGLIEYAC